MKIFFRNILILLVVLIFIYGALFCFRIVQDRKAVFVRDIRDGTIVKVLTHGYGFSFEGGMPWWFTLNEVSLERNFSHEFFLSIPALEELNDARYQIRIPVRMHFIINSDSPAAQEYLLKGEKGIDEAVTVCLRSLLGNEIGPFLAPTYRRDALYYRQHALEGDIVKKISGEVAKLGIEGASFSMPGGMFLPDMSSYWEGMRHLDNLNKLKRKNEIDTEILNGRLKQENLSNEEYYKRLSRISSLIKENPELLKYIYIDKLSDKIKLVNSIDTLDILGVFNKQKTDTEASKGDIDNLR
ncbi:MAG TPA: hypothetical protein PK926_08875 [Spirochaetota bacterium]|nr:hypothetical protein [Spirochaetota bacterium]HPI88597.1 hypothetical protein [Spirochaetota bacterium]HPR48238.1 hypothetical protein [Spirochaetota bacterium]